MQATKCDQNGPEHIHFSSHPRPKRLGRNIIDRLIDGEDPTLRGRVPFAVIDHIIEQADRADGLLQ
jgi:hypothetical protein